MGEQVTGGAPPDIVVVMTDQQRHDQVGFFRGSTVATPALDALVAGGVVFETAYSGSSTCIPARNALLTGVLNHRLPKQHGDLLLREGTWTVARALRSVGYETALIGRMHFTPMHADHGFDVVQTCEHLNATKHALGPDGAPDLDDYADWLVAEGVASWGRLIPGEPPELVPGRRPEGARTAFPCPRDGGRASSPCWSGRSPPSSNTGTPPGPSSWSSPSPTRTRRSTRPSPTRPATTPPRSPSPSTSIPAGRVCPSPSAMPSHVAASASAVGGSPSTARERCGGALAHTLGLIDHLDETIGRIVAGLDRERTVVAFASDHGDFAGHRGLAGKVPWIPFCTDMGWPAARKGRWKYILRPQAWVAVLFDLGGGSR